ncbi:MAG: thiaminase II [Oxalobacter formigenes]|nr:thiaminase II [Oxalobacter formigenes]
MSWTQTLFASAGPLIERIGGHPFNRALCDGTLAREKFIYYMQQDSLYLIDYARALALAGARFTAEKEVAQLLAFSQGALLAERELHTYYFRLFDVKPVTEKSPACLMYTSCLVERAATADIGEAFAALLPCFWVYNEVGKQIVKQSCPDNPYAKWIETYSGTDFSETVDQAVALAERLAEEAGPVLLKRMTEAFMTSCRMEYCFWDDAFHCRGWPV